MSVLPPPGLPGPTKIRLRHIEDGVQLIKVRLFHSLDVKRCQAAMDHPKSFQKNYLKKSLKIMKTLKKKHSRFQWTPYVHVFFHIWRKTPLPQSRHGARLAGLARGGTAVTTPKAPTQTLNPWRCSERNRLAKVLMDYICICMYIYIYT